MTTTPPPLTLTARSPEDLLAAAPVLLGFWPGESIVMLTFGAPRPFHARLDLPPLEAQDPRVLREVVRELLDPARRLGARAIAWLYFSADPDAARPVHRALAGACRRTGIDVVAGLVADGASYLDLERPGRSRATPYDISAHPFVVEALVEGRLPHRTREEMVASLEPDPVRTGPVMAALTESGLLDSGPPTDGRAVRDESGWVSRIVARAVLRGEELAPSEMARLLWVLQAPRVRDAALCLLDRPGARAQVHFWSTVLRCTPDRLVAAPAVLLGWAAWQAGDGALAWAAVDRCRRGDPEYALAGHLDRILRQAVPPDLWRAGSGLPSAQRPPR